MITRDRDRVKRTKEVFTPPVLGHWIIDTFVPIEKLKDPNTVYLDKCCGDGTGFLVPLKNILLQYHSEEHILENQIFGIDREQDNCEETKINLGIKENGPGCRNVQCADSRTYDMSFGRKISFGPNDLFETQ